MPVTGIIPFHLGGEILVPGLRGVTDFVCAGDTEIEARRDEDTAILPFPDVGDSDDITIYKVPDHSADAEAKERGITASTSGSLAFGVIQAVKQIKFSIHGEVEQIAYGYDNIIVRVYENACDKTSYAPTLPSKQPGDPYADTSGDHNYVGNTVGGEDGVPGLEASGPITTWKFDTESLESVNTDPTDHVVFYACGWDVDGSGSDGGDEDTDWTKHRANTSIPPRDVTINFSDRENRENSLYGYVVVISGAADKHDGLITQWNVSNFRVAY